VHCYIITSRHVAPLRDGLSASAFVTSQYACDVTVAPAAATAVRSDTIEKYNIDNVMVCSLPVESVTLNHSERTACNMQRGLAWLAVESPVISCYVAARRHICFCFMAKSAFWRGFSALAPYTGVGPI